MVHPVNDEGSDFVRLELAVVVTNFDKHEISLLANGVVQSYLCS